MRSLYKGLFVSRALAQSCLELDKKKVLSIYSRSSTILPCLIGQDCRVYNGVRFFFVNVTAMHIGYKFGEFAPTKKAVKSKVKVKKVGKLKVKTAKKNVKGK